MFVQNMMIEIIMMGRRRVRSRDVSGQKRVEEATAFSSQRPGRAGLGQLVVCLSSLTLLCLFALSGRRAAAVVPAAHKHQQFEIMRL